MDNGNCQWAWKYIFRYHLNHIVSNGHSKLPFYVKYSIIYCKCDKPLVSNWKCMLEPFLVHQMFAFGRYFLLMISVHGKGLRWRGRLLALNLIKQDQPIFDLQPVSQSQWLPKLRELSSMNCSEYVSITFFHSRVSRCYLTIYFGHRPR